MRLLCIDHYFGQDIEGMRLARGAHKCWSVPFEDFFELARPVFPDVPA